MRNTVEAKLHLFHPKHRSNFSKSVRVGPSKYIFRIPFGKSIPVTLAPACANHSAWRPVPHPISRTRSPWTLTQACCTKGTFQCLKWVLVIIVDLRPTVITVSHFSEWFHLKSRTNTAPLPSRRQMRPMLAARHTSCSFDRDCVLSATR